MTEVRPTKNVFLQVLWTGVDSSIPSLFLFTDTKKYVFNCGEGLQRLFTQRKLKLGRLEAFFLTRYQWSHMGGLPGFGMTLRDKGNVQRNVQNADEISQSQSTSSVNIGENTEALSNLISLETETGASMDQEGTGNETEPLNQLNSLFETRDQKESCMDQDTMNKTEPLGQLKQLETEDKLSEDKRKIRVYSPEGMTGILDAAKGFLHFEDTGFEIEVTDYHWDDQLAIKSYKDNEITLYPISIYNKNGNKQSEPCSKDDVVKTVDISPKCFPPAVCYACHLNAFPGKFDVKKAEKLGVGAGPVRGNLQRGESIVLDNGKTVTPQEVLGPEIPGPKFLIIDCPSVSYIESLIQNSYLNKYLSEPNGANLILHLSPEDVCKNDQYTKWTNKFPAFTKHMYLNNVFQENVVFESQHSLQIMLNCIDSKLFPLMEEHRSLKAEKTYTSDMLKNFTKIKLRELLGKPGKVIDDRDTKSEINYPELLHLANQALNAKYVSGTEMQVHGKRLHEEDTDTFPNKKINIDSDSNSSVLNSQGNCSNCSSHIFPKIVCLGTGASNPSKYRNVSGTLVLLSENDAVLFDCGEGTYCELVRHYGDNIELIISKIKLIFISHMHADHHLGIITLISKLNKLQGQTNDSFLIMAPHRLFKWLSNYAGISETLRFRFISCEDAYNGFSVAENIHIKPVKVQHPGAAHGIVMEYKNNLKITYSGDTKPCEALITAGMNSQLLIHEATFDDEMIEDALERKHSTSSQALEVARKMNAECILLTHISQRYPKIPVHNDNALSCQTAYAFDHMEITLDDIPKFNDLLPALNALFEDKPEEE